MSQPRRVNQLLPAIKTGTATRIKMDLVVINELNCRIPGVSLTDKVNRLFRFIFHCCLDILPEVDSPDWDKLAGIYIAPDDRSKRLKLTTDERKLLVSALSRIENLESQTYAQERRQDEYVRFLRELVTRFPKEEKVDRAISTCISEIEDIARPFKAWTNGGLHQDLESCQKTICDVAQTKENREWSLRRAYALEEEIIRRCEEHLDSVTEELIGLESGELDPNYVSTGEPDEE